MFTQREDKKLFEQARDYAFAYIDNLDQLPVFPKPGSIQNLAGFDQSLPEEPQSAAETLRLLDTLGSPATVTQSGGRYFGFVNGSALPISLAARWLADVWNQNTALYVMSPIAAKLEQICEQWLSDLLNLPAGTAAGLVGGSSVATLCALAAGRYQLLKNLGWNANETGLFGAPPIRVIVSEQAHSSVFRALAVLGLGNKRVELAGSDAEGRIDAARLPALDASTLLILQAGNVNSGAFDDFEHICKLARAAGAWVHIDGAFGLWAAASPSKKYLTGGIEMADSWSLDAHKTLNSSYDCGILLCKNREALVASMQTSGAYFQYGEARDNMHYSADMSRRARAVELWASLRFLGRSGVAELVDGLCERAQQFADELKKSGFKILNEVVFNQVLVACDTPAQTKATLAGIQASGECWCGGTTWQDQPAIRISVCSWATTPEDVSRSVRAFIKARETVQV